VTISTFNGLNVALSGLRAQQSALDVTSHNIANANTEGYSRQVADLTEADPLSNVSVWGMIFPGQLGQGVSVAAYRRIRDVFTDTQLRQAYGQQAGESVRYRELSGVELTLPEPSSSGLGQAMTDFFSAWQAVSNAPESLAARQALAQTGASLASAFNGAATSFTSMRANDDAEIDANVSNINAITTQIDKLNQQIGDAVLAGAQLDPTTKAILTPGQAPNDLLDQRDKLLDDLSKVADVTNVSYDDEQRATVVVAGKTLVTSTPGTTALTRADVDTAFTSGALTRGTLFGLEDAWSNMLNEANPTSYAAQLDTLAQSLHDAVNTQHALGNDLSGTAGGLFFDFTSPTGPPGAAARLTMSSAIMADPTKIAAATAGEGPGSAGNATAIINLQQAATTAGSTFQDYYNGLQSALGTAAQDSKRRSDANDIVVNGLTDRRQQSSGVSLDEEMSNMIRYQQAYAAAARIMSTMNQNLDTLMNLGR
jgi:flagellar hook-associated protein 1 FlgK